MSGADMNDPHVDKLFYRVITPEHIDYDKAPPISGETDKFKWDLNKDHLLIEMKIQCATENDAKEIVDEYLKGWEITAGILDGPESLAFKFDSSVIVNQPSSHEKVENAGIFDESLEAILLVSEATDHVSYDRFPPLSKDFKASPEAEMMFMRYKLYREGRETLLGLAHWCFTVLEYSAGGRSEAADQYMIDYRVLRKLGELCANRGDIREARKHKGTAGITPLRPAEREWIRAVVKRLILRVGEYAYHPVARMPMITMSDFPSTT
jgi:hypothetical protein